MKTFSSPLRRQTLHGRLGDRFSTWSSSFINISKYVLEQPSNEDIARFCLINTLSTWKTGTKLSHKLVPVRPLKEKTCMRELFRSWIKKSHDFKEILAKVTETLVHIYSNIHNQRTWYSPFPSGKSPRQLPRYLNIFENQDQIRQRDTECHQLNREIFQSKIYTTGRARKSQYVGASTNIG